MEFECINIEETSVPITKIPIDNSLGDLNVIEIPQKIIPEPICNACQEKTLDIADLYPDSGEYFKLENLLSELVDPYQRAIARQNLGIADVYSQIWGNLSGNISNQKDLYDILLSKANIDSPIFTGFPKVPLASATEDSDIIASTRWVNNRLSQLGNTATNLTYFIATPILLYVDDANKTVTLDWQYFNPISEQRLNGVNLNINIRSVQIQNVTSTRTLTLQYTYNGNIQISKLTVQVVYPIFYGISLDTLSRTGDKTITVNSGTQDYIYIKTNNVSEFNVNGFTGGFELVNTETLLGTTYYIYKSVNYGLGNTTITIL